MEQARGAILLALPPELRDRVYYFLLVREQPFPIRIPRPRTFGDLHNSDARASILYVNTQIHHEAIRAFYAYNTFIVGNGFREQDASLKGLKCFLQNIPPAIIACISHVSLHIYLLTATGTFDRNRSMSVGPRLANLSLVTSEAIPFEPTAFDSGLSFTLGSPAEAEEIRQIHQRLRKHFTGITSLTIDWITPTVQRSIHPAYILPKAAIISLLAKTVMNLMRLPRLRTMNVLEDECIYSTEIVDKVASDSAQEKKDILLGYPLYKNGVSGRLRGEEREQREIRLFW